MGGSPGRADPAGLEVSKQAAADHRLAFDLDALPGTVHRVSVLLALPTGAGGPVQDAGSRGPSSPSPASTGSRSPATPSPAWTRSRPSSPWSSTADRAYWKVRAVGQGYAGGLARTPHRPGPVRGPAARGQHQRSGGPGAGPLGVGTSAAYGGRGPLTTGGRLGARNRTSRTPHHRAPPGPYRRSPRTTRRVRKEPRCRRRATREAPRSPTPPPSPSRPPPRAARSTTATR